MSARWVLCFGAAFFVAGIGACDFGPSGAGSLEGRVAGPSLGGVVLEVVGIGIRSFEGRGSTRAYSAPVSERENAHRVILIHPQAGDIVFDILVEDVGMESPVITVVSATGTDNLELLAGSIEVTVER